MSNAQMIMTLKWFNFTIGDCLPQERRKITNADSFVKAESMKSLLG